MYKDKTTNKSNKPIPLVKNRKERRLAEKAYKFKAKSVEEMNTLIEMLNEINLKKNTENSPNNKGCLPEGQKVKLNVEKIINNVNWNGLQENYKAFVEENKETIFTVEYDKADTVNPHIVCLAEDTTNPKWLWSDVDLLVLDETDGVYKEMFLIEAFSELVNIETDGVEN